ncbi:MAG: carboxypeptidase regulatory-like domain-containing protein [Chloroflexi bacterium]|nr:carboxypeptidase regulatory-like domain-containing protein [Chloroflexota bacterium]
MILSSFRQKTKNVFLSLLLLLIVALSLLPAPTFAQSSPPVYDVTRQCFAVADERVTNTGKDSQDTLVRLDRTNGDTFAIGLTGTLNVEAIAFGPNNILYGVDAGQPGILDVNTGVFTALPLPFGTANGSLGPQLLGDVDGIFYDMHNEQFYGVAHYARRRALLFIFNPATGAYVPNAFGPGVDYVETVGVSDIDDIAIDPVTDVMYATSEVGALYTIDKTTGAATQVAPFRYPNPYPASPLLAGQLVDDMEGLSFFNDGQLYGSTGNNGPDPIDSNRLFQIDKATGVTTFLGTFPTGLQDFESIACLTADTYIKIKKFTNGPGQTPQDADTLTGPLIPVGSVVTWSYMITNTGMLTLTNLTLSDDKLGIIGPNEVSNCPPATTLLGPGDSILCTATGVASAGQYTNTAIITGSTPIPLIVPQRTVTATNPSHYFGTSPGIDIEKFTNGQQADGANDADVPLITPGATVTWQYRVTNTGNTPFAESQIKVTDSLLGPITQIVNKGNNDTTLAPHETWIYQKTGTAVNLLDNSTGITKVPGCDPNQTGVMRLAYENIGMVTAGTSADADASHYCNPPTPAIDIEKFTNGSQADGANDVDVPQISPNGVVTWTYQVLNTGNVPFNETDVKVVDNVLGPITQISNKGNDDNVLAPGEVWLYEKIGTAADLLNNPGSVTVLGCDPAQTGLTRPAYENVGTVTAPDVSDTDKSHYCNPPTPGLTLEKLTNGRAADGPNDPDVPLIVPGATVTWTYQVKNIGNVPFSEATVKVKDDVLGAITQIVNKGDGDTILAPGETWIYQKLGVAANLLRTPSTVPVVAGCDPNQTGQTRPTYENIGTVTAETSSATDLSHYCNPLATIGDRVFRDINPAGANPEQISQGNGLQDPGESGVDGIKVQLYTTGNSFVAETTTANNGLYRFNNVLPGAYYLVFVNPLSHGVWSLANQGQDDALDSDADPSLTVSVGNFAAGTAARTVVFTVKAGDVDLRWDAGIVESIGALGDYVWHDRNGNGLQDEAADQGVPDAQVKLFTNAGQLVATTTTNAAGYYRFASVPLGQYYIQFSLPTGFNGFTLAHQGSDKEKDSDVITVDDAGGRTPLFTFAADTGSDFSWDAGVYQNASVGDFVWLDDGDGIQQPSEKIDKGLSNIAIELYKVTGDGVIGQGATAQLAKASVTAINGIYQFEGLMPGRYYIHFTLPTDQAKYVFVTPGQGGNREADADATMDTGDTAIFTLVSGQFDPSIDAGIQVVTAENPTQEPTREPARQLFLPLVAND